MDTDKDGLLSSSDLQAAFAAHGKNIGGGEAQAMLDEVDGPVNFTQMVTLFASKMAGGSDDDEPLVGFNILWKNQLLGPAKMLAFISLASLIALSQAAVLAAQKAVKHQHYLASIANPPVVPGLDVHAAALNAQLARMGVPAGQPAHMAALARVEQQQAEIIAIQKSLV